ncbi:hypothetical protein LCGC14_2586630 [marine sediment metagenome]|uniref:Uncharacterized protein n=1 Tax=marine sediment metagenome TaxID=412755 RepID=A0A0F9ACS4_9ZZZZ
MISLAIWRWGGLFYASMFPRALIQVGVRRPEQGRYGHFTGVDGNLLRLAFKLGFQDDGVWKRYLNWW